MDQISFNKETRSSINCLEVKGGVVSKSDLGSSPTSAIHVFTSRVNLNFLDHKC